MKTPPTRPPQWTNPASESNVLFPLFRFMFGRRLDNIRRLLRDLEWCATDSDGLRCPICFSVSPERGHSKVCRLNRMIEFFGRWE